jgi:hypothetical protein
MAESAQEKLLASFSRIAGQETSGSGAARALSTAFGGETLVDVAQANAASPFSGKASGSGGSGLARFFKSGLGLGSLMGELLGLFGGGDSETASTLTKYAMPSSLSFEAADTGDGLSNADYDQTGRARAYGGPGLSEPSGYATSGANAPQITVNVQAMDSQSFLDRSTDIAAAVRHAMLNSNSINDVVNDL